MSNNIKTEVKDNKLIITVDVSAKAIKDAPRSSTGKSNMVASTGGFIAINDLSGVKVSLNVIQK